MENRIHSDDLKAIGNMVKVEMAPMQASVAAIETKIKSDDERWDEDDMAVTDGQIVDPGRSEPALDLGAEQQAQGAPPQGAV